jgi:predicted alpha/beta-fold hydrolase
VGASERDRQVRGSKAARGAVLATVEGIGGHAWTVLSHLRDKVRPPSPPPAMPWRTELVDPALGPVRLSGLIDHVPGAERMVIILHGMGGSAERAYCAHTAAAARARGMSSLRLNLRGADGTGEDLYHIGLVEDLAAALAHPEIARYREVVALGYSLGGHLALRFAALHGGLRGVATICAPLDLAEGVRHIDHPLRWPYRRHLLDGVKAVYRQVAARRPMPLAIPAMDAIRTVREWDQKVVAPRFGFAGADDYYGKVGVGPLLARMELPILFVDGGGDPMIPAWTLRPLLEGAASSVEVRWITGGGHLGFPGESRILASVIEWLATI